MSFNARNQCQVYNPNVGYILGKQACYHATLLYLIKHISNKAEGTDAFSQFHLYVCSAFLVKWSDRLKDMDFQVSYRSSNPLMIC